MAGAFGEALELFRDTVRRFLERELQPRNGCFDTDAELRAFWRQAGELGLIGASIPEEYGGPGLDRLAIVLIGEEIGRLPAGAVAGASLTSDIATSVLIDGGTEEQKRYWFPKILAGEIIQALAMTEPGAGSDAGAIATTARRDGDAYILNGSKCFISNGTIADLIYVIAHAEGAGERTKGMSCFIVPGDAPGLTRRKHATLGYKGGDTGELFLDNVVVPGDNLVGLEGQAFRFFDAAVTLDRLHIASRSWAAADAAFRLTLDHARQRRMFGQRLVDMQNTQFKLGWVETELAVARAFIDRCLAAYRDGNFTPHDGAMLKIWVPEMESRIMDALLQLWGGNGWMEDQPIAQMFTAARLQRIWAGATELQLAMLGRRYTKP